MQMHVQDTSSVAIPEDGLNLAPYCTPGAAKLAASPLYDLYAVVCHYGTLEASRPVVLQQASDTLTRNVLIVGSCSGAFGHSTSACKGLVLKEVDCCLPFWLTHCACGR